MNPRASLRQMSTTAQQTRCRLSILIDVIRFSPGRDYVGLWCGGNDYRHSRDCLDRAQLINSRAVRLAFIATRSSPALANSHGLHPSLLRVTVVTRGNLAHSWLSNASLTRVGGRATIPWPGLGRTQLHAPHPHAAKVLSSRQTSSLAMME